MATNMVFQYTTGKLELALTNNGFFGGLVWEFPQDIKNKADIIKVRTFKYGNYCGILKKLGYDKVSTLRAKGDTWYLITKCGKPVLKNSNPKCPTKLNPEYIELRELSFNFDEDTSNMPVQLKLDLIWV